MSNEFDVSVIVASYHPNIKKMYRTLSSIVTQKEIEFELIVTDDGSQQDCFGEIETFLNETNFNGYRLLKNPQNVGTVRNCYNAVKEAKGRYIFLTSPGDLLHDDLVLHDFFAYAQKYDAKIVFGEPVLYRAPEHGKKMELVDRVERPYWPELFNAPVTFGQQVSFCFGNYIIGATYFREKNCLLKYLEDLLPFCKYAEDNTTTALALADHIRTYYFPRKIVFYELGDGVTSSGSSKWRELIRKDFTEAIRHLTSLHPENKAFAALLHLYTHETKLFPTLSRTVFYPSIAAVQLRNKFRTKHRVSYDTEDEQLLRRLLNEEERYASN